MYSNVDGSRVGKQRVMERLSWSESSARGQVTLRWDGRADKV